LYCIVKKEENRSLSYGYNSECKPICPVGGKANVAC